MDYLSLFMQPIGSELADFVDLFNKSLMHGDGLLSQALDHIRQRAGKRMRPMLILLMAKNFGKVTPVTQHSAVGLELLHTASLVHDDVVDDYFTQVKKGIIDIIAAEPSQGEYALDLLMIAKYFERIGDHCTNIAEWVEFSVTGVHKDCQ